MSDATSSKFIQYAESKGWAFKNSGDQVILEKCPSCGAKDHFYAAVTGNKDGLWECKKCSKSGNLYQLRVDQGDRDPNVTSQRDWAGSDKTEALPNVAQCHEALMADDEAMDYLTTVRGFSPEVIIRMKLGLLPNRYFRDLNKETKAIVVPYLKDGRPTFAKYRSFPPDAKAFSSPSGWEPPLYGQEVLVPGVQDVVFVEGEYDCLSCLSNGVERVLGVPGANLKKAAWIDLLDEVKPEKIYLLYDNDRAGEKGAQSLAERIGIERCFKMVIPPFTYITDEGEEKQGKDINDWFRHGGGTLEKFEQLKEAARKFDVKSVRSLVDALDDLERDFEGKDREEAKYVTQWDALNWKIGGFEDGDVIDLIAKGGVGKSTVSLNIIDDLVARYGETCLFVCGEMTPQRLSRKWLSMVTKTDDSPAKSEQDKIDKMTKLKDAIPLAKNIVRSRDGEILFSKPSLANLDELYELVKQAKRRYGIKFLVIDNLQLFCDTTLTNPAHRTIHLSQLSKNLMKLTKDLGLVTFRVIQPRGIPEDKIPSIGDADGSSQIEKDCDTAIGLHRAKKANINAHDFQAMGGYMDEEVALEPEMLFNVCKSRYSAGGRCTLYFDGATSSVSEIVHRPSQTQSVTRSQHGHVPSETAFGKVDHGI